MRGKARSLELCQHLNVSSNLTEPSLLFVVSRAATSTTMECEGPSEDVLCYSGQASADPETSDMVLLLHPQRPSEDRAVCWQAQDWPGDQDKSAG